MFPRFMVVFAVAGALAAPATAALAAAPAHVSHVTCRSGYYKNVSGVCVHRPVRAPSAPPDASAHCRDGSYSFSQHASGTCSGHGGVAVWIHHP